MPGYNPACALDQPAPDCVWPHQSFDERHASDVPSATGSHTWVNWRSKSMQKRDFGIVIAPSRRNGEWIWNCSAFSGQPGGCYAVSLRESELQFDYHSMRAICSSPECLKSPPAGCGHYF